MQLFQNGDIIICYVEGEMEGNDINAGVVESLSTWYNITYSKFNGDTRTYDWPTNKCWIFLSPQLPTRDLRE
jgi:hypothetical protein